MSEYLYAYQFMCRQTYISRLERLYVATSRHSFVCALSQEICQQVRCFRCLCNIAYHFTLICSFFDFPVQCLRHTVWVPRGFSQSLGQRRCCHPDLCARFVGLQLVCQHVHICTYVRTYIDIGIRTQILFVIYHTHTGTCSCLDITRFSFLHLELEFLLRFDWRQRSVLPRVVSCAQCFFF